MANDVKIRLAVEGTAEAQDQFSRLDARLGVLNGTLVKTAHYGTALAGAFGLAIPALSNTVRATIGAADAITTLQNQLKLATGSATEAGQAYTALFAIAQKSRVSFTELGSTFASISRAGQELGISQSRLLTVTQSIGNAMAISGGSAQGMQAALTQLGQGLSSGVLRGEELNSVMEQSPRLAKALADGLGVPLGELRELGKAGQLTSEQVINALEKAGPQLAKEIESSVMTVGQAMTVLGNAATKFVGEMDQATHASSNLATGIKGIASAVESASTSASVSFLTSDFKAAGEAMDRAKLQGAGFWGQMNQGAGMLIGRAAGLGLINRDFMTLSAVVSDATATLKRLDEQEQRDGKLSIYSMSERAAAARDLARANRELAQSKNDTVVSSTQQGMEASGKAREKYMAGQVKDMADLNALRNKLDGVPESYIKDMAEIIRLNQAGVLVGKEYTDTLAKQQATLLKKTGATQSESTALTEAAKGLNLYNDLLDKASGYTASYAEDQNKLSAALKKGLIPTQADYAKAVQALLDQQPFMVKAHAAEKKAIEDSAKELGNLMDAYEKAATAGVASAIAAATAAEDELAHYGLIKSEVQSLTLVKLQEARESAAMAGEDVSNIQKRIDAQKRLIAASTGMEAIKANEEATKVTQQAAKDTVAEWQKSVDQYETIFREGFAGMVNGGKGTWQSFTKSLTTTFKTSVVDQIYKSFAKPFVVQFIASMLGVTGAGSAIASEASGGIASSLGISAAISKAGAYVAEGASTVATAILGFGADALAFEGGMAMMGSATGVTSFMAGAGQAMAAMGPVGWAALAAVAVIAAMGLEGGETRSGGYYGYSFDGQTAADPFNGATGRADVSRAASSVGALAFGGPSGGNYGAKEVKAAIDGTVVGINATLKALGSAATVSGFQAAYETSDNDRGGALAGGTLSTGATFGQSGNGSNYAGDMYDPTKGFNLDTKGALSALTLELQQAYLEAMQVATDIPTTVSQLIADSLNGADVASLSAEATQTLLTTVDGLIQKVTVFGAAMDLLPFEHLKNLSFDASAGLMAAAGGFDALVGNLGGFYQGFFTAEEQRAQSIKNTSAAFESLGLVMPVLDDGARAAFKAMVLKAEAELDGTDATAKAYASLLALQAPMNEIAPAFATVADAAPEATTAVSDFAANMQKVTDDLQSQGASLQAQWDKIFLSEDAYRTKQIAGMTDLQVAQYDTNKSLQSTIDAFTAMAQVSSDLQSTGASLQAQWDKLFLSEDAYRTKQITGMTDLQVAQYDSNTALQKSIDAFASTATASTAAAAAIADTAASLVKSQQLALSASMAGIEGVLSDIAAGVASQKAIVTDAYNTQAESIKASLDTVGSSISNLKNLSSSLKSTLDGMRISGSDGAYRADAQAQITAALAKARSGGGLPVDGQLASALRTVGQPSQQLFATFTDYARDYYKTANDLASLADLTDAQLTGEELTQSLLTDQTKALKAGFDMEIKRLDALVTSAQSDADAVTKTTRAILSLTDALNAFRASLGATLSNSIATAFETYDTNQSNGIEWGEFLTAFAGMASESTLKSLFAETDANGNGQISQLEAINANTANLLAAMRIAGAGGTAAAGATYSGTDIAAAIDAMTKAGASTAQIIAAASGGYGLTSSSVAQVAAVTGNTGIVDYQAQANAATALSSVTRDSITTQAMAMAAAQGISAERALYNYATSSGINAATVDKLMGYPNGTSNAWAASQGLPAFEQGINRVPYDMTARIHKDEAVIPRAFNPFNPGATQFGGGGGSSNAEVASALRAMAARLEKIEANTRATALHASDAADALDRQNTIGVKELVA